MVDHISSFRDDCSHIRRDTVYRVLQYLLHSLCFSLWYSVTLKII